MNTSRVVFLLAVGVGLLFQSGCGEAKVRGNATDNTTDNTKLTAAEPQAGSTNEQGGDQENGPKIHIENPVCNFDVVGPSKKVNCTFTFKNVGESELVINKIASTCQCTVGELKKKTYAPGESGTIEATYLSGTYPGPVEKYLHILSNDKSNPSAELTIKGRIELQVVTIPEDRINLFLNQENGGAVPITVKSKDGKAFAIKSFSSSHNTISAKFDPNEEKTEFVITPVVDLDKLKANLTGSIQIGVSHSDTRVVNLSYSALPMYAVSPPRMIVQDAEPGKHVDRELLIMNNYNQKVEIESITSMNGCMEVTKKDVHGSSARLMVRITVPPQEGQYRRYLSDRLTIKMKDGEEASVTCTGWYKLATLK